MEWLLNWESMKIILITIQRKKNNLRNEEILSFLSNSYIFLLNFRNSSDFTGIPEI